MSGHEKWLELADIYAAGALDGRELEEFQAHLSAGCRECESYVHEMEEALTMMPQSLAKMTAPAAVKIKLMQQIENESLAGAGAGAAAPSFNWAAGFVMLGLAAALGAAVFQYRTKMTSYKKVTEQLMDADTQVVPMNGMEASPKATAKMMWNPKKCIGTLMASKLPKLPEGMVYELWAISGSTPVAAGTFTVDENGCGKLEMKELPKDLKIEKFAVTMEPAGGLAAPTGKLQLAGAV